nr:replication-associated protein [Avon-Heathcote Estuary associated circular virus 10]
MPGTEPGTKTYRAICFTEFKKLTNWDDVKSQLRYYAYAEETCPNTGKKHYQGFAYSWKKVRFSAWKKMFPTAHIEQMRGNFRENTAYCSKEGNLIEFGEKPNENGVQGTAIEYKRRLEEGQTTMEIAEDENLFGQYLHSYRALEKYEQHFRGKKLKVDHNVPEVYIRWGPSGTGKTHGVFKQYGRDKVCIVPDNTGHWFDNCNNSDVMLFDDVEIDAIPPISKFLRLTDRYPMQVPTKGGFIWWKPKVIVFTSNLPWEQWWNTLNTEHKIAVRRRVTRVTRIYKDHEKVEYENANYELLSQTQGFFASPPQQEEGVREEPVHSQEEGEQVHEESGSASEEHSAV